MIRKQLHLSHILWGICSTIRGHPWLVRAQVLVTKPLPNAWPPRRQQKVWLATAIVDSLVLFNYFLDFFLDLEVKDLISPADVWFRWKHSQACCHAVSHQTQSRVWGSSLARMTIESSVLLSGDAQTCSLQAEYSGTPPSTQLHCQLCTVTIPFISHCHSNFFSPLKVT